jgi:hypothetical protein
MSDPAADQKRYTLADARLLAKREACDGNGHRPDCDRRMVGFGDGLAQFEDVDDDGQWACYCGLVTYVPVTSASTEQLRGEAL